MAEKVHWYHIVMNPKIFDTDEYAKSLIGLITKVVLFVSLGFKVFGSVDPSVESIYRNLGLETSTSTPINHWKLLGGSPSDSHEEVQKRIQTRASALDRNLESVDRTKLDSESRALYDRLIEARQRAQEIFADKKGYEALRAKVLKADQREAAKRPKIPMDRSGSQGTSAPSSQSAANTTANMTLGQRTALAAVKTAAVTGGVTAAYFGFSAAWATEAYGRCLHEGAPKCWRVWKDYFTTSPGVGILAGTSFFLMNYGVRRGFEWHMNRRRQEKWNMPFMLSAGLAAATSIPNTVLQKYIKAHFDDEISRAERNYAYALEQLEGKLVYGSKRLPRFIREHVPGLSSTNEAGLNYRLRDGVKSEDVEKWMRVKRNAAAILDRRFERAYLALARCQNEEDWRLSVLPFNFREKIGLGWLQLCSSELGQVASDATKFFVAISAVEGARRGASRLAANQWVRKKGSELVYGLQSFFKAQIWNDIQAHWGSRVVSWPFREVFHLGKRVTEKGSTYLVPQLLFSRQGLAGMIGKAGAFLIGSFGPVFLSSYGTSLGIDFVNWGIKSQVSWSELDDIVEKVRKHNDDILLFTEDFVRPRKDFDIKRLRKIYLDESSSTLNKKSSLSKTLDDLRKDWNLHRVNVIMKPYVEKVIDYESYINAVQMDVYKRVAYCGWFERTRSLEWSKKFEDPLWIENGGGNQVPWHVTDADYQLRDDEIEKYNRECLKATSTMPLEQFALEEQTRVLRETLNTNSTKVAHSLKALRGVMFTNVPGLCMPIVQNCQDYASTPMNLRTSYVAELISWSGVIRRIKEKFPDSEKSREFKLLSETVEKVNQWRSGDPFDLLDTEIPLLAEGRDKVTEIALGLSPESESDDGASKRKDKTYFVDDVRNRWSILARLYASKIEFLRIKYRNLNVQYAQLQRIARTAVDKDFEPANQEELLQTVQVGAGLRTVLVGDLGAEHFLVGTPEAVARDTEAMSRPEVLAALSKNMGAISETLRREERRRQEELVRQNERNQMALDSILGMDDGPTGPVDQGGKK